MNGNGGPRQVSPMKIYGPLTGRFPRAPATASRRDLFESLRRNAPHAGAFGNFSFASGTLAGSSERKQ
jgi:hypothetical protein